MSQNNISERIIKSEPQNESYPSINSHLEKILIIVKTAPNPTIKYLETVCTAGITVDGKWIRIYPLPFRYIDFYKRFTKYQWIEVSIKKRPTNKDFRIDSYEPDWKTIKILGKPLKADTWVERKKYVLPTASAHFEEIKSSYD